MKKTKRVKKQTKVKGKVLWKKNIFHNMIDF